MYETILNFIIACVTSIPFVLKNELKIQSKLVKAVLV